LFAQLDGMGAAASAELPDLEFAGVIARASSRDRLRVQEAGASVEIRTSRRMIVSRGLVSLMPSQMQKAAKMIETRAPQVSKECSMTRSWYLGLTALYPVYQVAWN
jgi:hypothetical protein